MKRFGLALVVGALAVLAISGSASAGGPYDSITGAVKRTFLPPNEQATEHHIVVSAQNGPQGAKGHLSFKTGKGPGAVGYEGVVTCVNVVGNLGKIGIRVTKSTRTDFAQVGQYQEFRVQDYGNPSGDDQMDSISPRTAQSEPVSCDEPVSETTTTFRGNLTVQDGS
jgi:hypothetical protein